MTFPSFADGMPDERTAVVDARRRGGAGGVVDLPVAVGLEEGGIRHVTMADVTVEKVGEEASVARRRGTKTGRSGART